MTHTRHTATFPAIPSQVARARRWLADILGSAHPCTDTAVLLLSETFTNSLLYSRSREDGVIEVDVALFPDHLRVEVTDAGSTGPLPSRLVQASPDAESGRGLPLLSALAKDWGHLPLPTGHLRTHFTLVC